MWCRPTTKGSHGWWIGSAIVSALGALDPSRGLFSLLRPGAMSGALRETHRVNMSGAPFTACSERNIKFRVSREAAHETSAWHRRCGRLARLGDSCICSIRADACYRCSGAIQPFSCRARTPWKTIGLSNRFARIERTGATRSDAAVRRTGAARLPKTGNRSEDRRSTAAGFCKELHAIGSVGHYFCLAGLLLRLSRGGCTRRRRH
jgi:hypothetical protein